MKKNKKNVHKVSLFTNLSYVLKQIATELYKTAKFAGLGLFKVFDFIMTNLITIVTYIFYAIYYISMYVGKFTYTLGKFMYYKVFKPIGFEVYYLFKAMYLGAYRVGKILFYEIPLFIFNSFSDFFDLIRKKIKLLKERLMYFFKHTPNTVKNYFLDRFNNISIVKHYRNKKERELEVLLIDKFGKDAERSSKKQTYKYLVKNEEGKLITGYFAALSRLDVHSYLLDEGYEVYEIKTNWWINFAHGESKYLEKQMKAKDLIFWLAQLSTYLKAGIPLTDSVKILAEQDKRKKYKKVYDSVIYELSMGEAFSDALRKQGSVFPPLLINMIKGAELIGDLENTLDDMSKYYEERESTRKQLIGSLVYPAVILVFSLVVVIFMVVYIIPQFEGIYSSLGAELNPIVLFLLKFSAFLKTNYMLLIAGFILVVVLLTFMYKKVKAFRTLVQYIAMHLPLVGKLIIYNEMHLFAKTFSVLNKNNVLLTDSIDILSKITSNEFYKMIMYDTISNLLRGDKISLSFKDNWAVPTLAYYMISTGEATGELSEMLEKVSVYYEQEQRNLGNSLKTLIEPILMIILAVIVGGIMISIIVPMYDITKNIL